MEVVEKRRPSMITNVGAHSRREDVEFLREHRLVSSLGMPDAFECMRLSAF